MQSNDHCFVSLDSNEQMITANHQNLCFYGKTRFEGVHHVEINQSTYNVDGNNTTKENNNNFFSLSDLPNIRRVVVASRMFMNMDVFTIANMDCLQSLEIDYHSFKQIKEFILKGM